MDRRIKSGDDNGECDVNLIGLCSRNRVPGKSQDKLRIRGMEIGEELVRKLWRDFDQRRFRDALDLLAEDFVAVWPQTRERIVGRENFIALNENYPGVWRCRIEHLLETPGKVITEVRISDGAQTVYAISFLEIRGGKIASAREFFADENEPPFERSQWATREAPPTH
jgi:ketosteroid isomerase-like protein